MKLPNKSAVIEALRAQLARALSSMASAAANTREGVTHEDARAEGDKDMRSTEQSYVARGQAMRVEDLAESLQRFETTAWPSFDSESPLRAGALIGVLVDDEEEKFFFLVPYGGGTTVRIGKVEVTVVTPSSPVGGALLGKRVGDSFELTTRGQMREWSIENAA